MSEFDFINLGNFAFIDELYQKYLSHPEEVEPSWRFFFEGVRLAGHFQGVAQPQRGEAALLVEAFRCFGHLVAKTNPLKDSKNPSDIQELKIKNYGFSDLDIEVDSQGLLPKSHVKLGELIQMLKSIYCSSIGVELCHLSPDKRAFIAQKVEAFQREALSREDKKAILQDLNRSEIFETFIHRKYPGQKRFSLEGGESLIPMLNQILDKASLFGAQECVLGMAHRGRLNVLANILGKSYRDIFYEFSPYYMPDSCEGSGDVKYHKGFKAKKKTRSGKTLRLELCENPSHLESVNVIAEGMVKAKQLLASQEHADALVLPVLIHGDASVAGQGVVYETLQLSNLEGYEVGGTLHIVINNQVGFTAIEEETRSSLYCTDIGKAFDCPIFHVNGDDPEACVKVAKLAVELRHKFHCDVFIELVCYRKYGHSEGDEPMFTQPKFYQIIQKKKNVRNLYKDHLLEQGYLTQEEALALENTFLQTLEEEEKDLASYKGAQKFTSPQEKALTIPTSVEEKKLLELAGLFCSIPEEIQVHPKIQKLLQERLAALSTPQGIDWGLAEYLAYASLLVEGIPIRISGQDCRRGTFAHRHAVIVDQLSEKKYFPLQHLQKGQVFFHVYNSPLSEYGVMGFEFGFAQSYPKALVIWEAQFGDFANGAQIIIDQYISSAEQKWGAKNGLVLFLPHGYEGQGPEHSSARIERFLQLTSQANMQIVMPTHPAQMFHLLRIHALQKTKKPLVVFTPKAILRYGPSLSSLQDLSRGSFHEVFDDPNYTSATHLILCSGKVYYDLIEEREKRKTVHVAILRIEQLYPWPGEALKKLLAHYPHLKKYSWVQEEPRNMGAYDYICQHLREILPDNTKLCYVGRARSSSPAAGSLALHQQEKKEFLERVFKPLEG